MTDQNKHSGQEDFHAALAKAAAGTLDQSVESMDDLTSYKLKQIRQKALLPPVAKQFPYGINKQWAIAASFVVAVGAPTLFFLSAGHESNLETDSAAFLSQDILLDAQDFDDMDMLIAMEETDA